ncbi:N-6 DNA methylase [Streptomyces sp. NPDC060194]|uniref:N-6 DNA methylase n=1 Tax=Streptomyces sp. NPDC060194 TaxID=3347069 RepID=UPI00365F38F0
MPDRTSEVTAAGIARLAGVGRAAVSNWRRRHADFPKPVGGTEASPAFALTDVERWLREQGKLAEVPLRERVSQQIADHPAGPAAALSHAGSALLLARDRPTVWAELAKVPDDRLGRMLPLAVEEVLVARLGSHHAVNTDGIGASVPLVRAATELAAGLGPHETYELLLGRHLDANPRQYTLTPPGPAELMAALAGTAAEDAGPGDAAPRTVLDPAAGTGGLLRAVRRPTALYAQDVDPALASVTALRLALGAADGTRVAVRAGDVLRADAFPRLTADAVLCHPPFNERDWGHDELAYDPRWEYGFPARTESELAWVQHALARLRPGGTAVLLMPPAAASRRSGRRIRADLLRRGALRAVIALPAGVAPPNGVPLHLWVLARPDADQPAAPELLLVDTAGDELDAAGGRQESRAEARAEGARADWATVRAAVLDAWRPFARDGRADERPGISRSVPVIELLDDDVDLAPARHLPPPAAGGGAEALTEVRDRLTGGLRDTLRLTPPPARSAPPARRPLTTVGELARSGALVIRTGGAPAAGPVLTEHDVLSGSPPSGNPQEDGDEPVVLEIGDVVVPVLGGGSVTRVVDGATSGAALGRGLTLLRPDPAALDPWFVAGFLRGTANHRQASSYASTATRLDVRRLQLPRLAPAEQARYGARFRDLAAFEDALRLTARLGERLVQGMYDGLADGTVEVGTTRPTGPTVPGQGGDVTE